MKLLWCSTQQARQQAEVEGKPTVESNRLWPVMVMVAPPAVGHLDVLLGVVGVAKMFSGQPVTPNSRGVF